MKRSSVAAAVGLLTLAGAELAYLALAAYLIKVTRESPHLKPAHVNDAVVGATAALATVFGATQLFSAYRRRKACVTPAEDCCAIS